MRIAPFLLALLLAACETPTTTSLGNLGEESATPTTVSALDSLVDADGTISINGRVTDHAADARELILDDGTGLVRVVLPEELPVLVGHRLFVRGELRREDDLPVVRAVEWLYDSTAISVHSE